MSNLGVIDGQFSSNKPYLFRALYEWILDNDATPYILVDATKADVQIPREHVKDGQIVLNASPSAIQNWFADNSAISFSARFSGKAQNIYIPIKALLAVYAQENGLGMAFPAEPENEEASDIEVQQDEALKSDSESAMSAGKKKPSHLKVIK